MEAVQIYIASKKWLRSKLSRKQFMLPIEVQEYYQEIKSEAKQEETKLAYFFLLDKVRDSSPSEDLKIGWTEKGKPFFENTELKFNLTHSEAFIGLIIGKDEVGIDIQITRPVNRSVLERITNQEEINAYDSGVINFFQLWTRKEAVLKMTGDGLSAGASNVPVLQNQGEFNNQKYVWQDFSFTNNIYAAFATKERVEWELRCNF
jgi:4'-phosphopantetheinyl transferase